MPHVRSVSIGVWLTRGSRHEPTEHAGIAHFVEHMLFKGTTTRIGRRHRAAGGFDRRAARRVHLEGIRRLLHQGARRAPADCHRFAFGSGLTPTFAPEEIEREKKVILEEIKMVEDTPDDLVHELFAERFWNGHPLGRPILGHARQRVGARSPRHSDATFADAYVARNFVVVAVGNLEHDRLRALVERAFAQVPVDGSPIETERPDDVARHRSAAQGARTEPRLLWHAGLAAESSRIAMPRTR